MTDRLSLRSLFLTKAGWNTARIENLAGDASNRRYFRLYQDKQSAVLMDAAPETGEDVAPFAQVGRFLTKNGFSAPEILAESSETGFLLLEDLGDDLFARVLKFAPEMEREMYSAAIDVLVALHKIKAPYDMAPYKPQIMADLAALAFDWYAKAIVGPNLNPARDLFVRAFVDCLSALDSLTEVTVQRDYHAENLLWLPARTGIARVGLLDFQDAMAGHRAYDVVSLLQDARRDVSSDIETEMVERYVRATGKDETSFKTAYAVLGVQRNLRIIGVFARLCIRDAKPHYVDLIPRVWGYLEEDLKRIDCAKLETILMAELPRPDEQVCEILRKKCGTIQTP